MTQPTTQNSEAFNSYVVPHLEMLYRTAWSLTRSNVEAQDLVQDTLIRAFRAIDRFDGRYPKAWLLTIMRNTNINRIRKKKPDLIDNPDYVFERSTRFADSDDPETLTIEPTLSAAVETSFNALPERFRKIVELVDLNGLSYQEAADLAGIPVGTVMSRLHRARRRIREELDDHKTSAVGRP